jgi:adenylyltransferase/sulfurtransferase
MYARPQNLKYAIFQHLRVGSSRFPTHTRYDLRLLDVPLKELLSNPEAYVTDSSNDGLYVVCRLGNDSQIAAESLRRVTDNLIIKDIIGGVRAWSSQVDPQFPVY